MKSRWCLKGDGPRFTTSVCVCVHIGWHCWRSARPGGSLQLHVVSVARILTVEGHKRLAANSQQHIMFSDHRISQCYVMHRYRRRVRAVIGPGSRLLCPRFITPRARVVALFDLRWTKLPPLGGCGDRPRVDAGDDDRPAKNDRPRKELPRRSISRARRCSFRARRSASSTILCDWSFNCSATRRYGASFSCGVGARPRSECESATRSSTNVSSSLSCSKSNSSEKHAASQHAWWQS